MEINIPNQVWIYNEINRLLTPHCRHAWYLAVKKIFLSGLLNLREANTNNCISVRYIFLTNSVPRCWKWNAVVDNSQTAHVRFTEKASRKFSSRWAYCTGTWTDWSQRVVVFSFSLSGWFSFQKSDINYGIPRRPFSQRSIRQLYTARGIDGSRSIPWNVNYVTRNVPRDDRGEKVTIDCFLFETTT